MNESDFHWLCGLLEGEGSFMKGPPSRPQYPILTVTSTDEDVIQKVSVLLGASYCKVRKRQNHWKQSFSFRTHGKKAVELMLKMRPYMSKRRQAQIDAAVASYEARPNRGASKLTENQIRRVKYLIRENESVRSIWSVMRIKNHGAFPDIT